MGNYFGTTPVGVISNSDGSTTSFYQSNSGVIYGSTYTNNVRPLTHDNLTTWGLKTGRAPEILASILVWILKITIILPVSVAMLLLVLRCFYEF